MSLSLEQNHSHNQCRGNDKSKPKVLDMEYISDQCVQDASTTAVIKLGDATSSDPNDSDARYRITIYDNLVWYLVSLSLEQNHLCMTRTISVERTGSQSSRSWTWKINLSNVLIHQEQNSQWMSTEKHGSNGT